MAEVGEKDREGKSGRKRGVDLHDPDACEEQIDADLRGIWLKKGLKESAKAHAWRTFISCGVEKRGGCAVSK